MTTADVKRYIETEMPLEYAYVPEPGTVKVIHDPHVTGTFAARFQDRARGVNGVPATIDLLFITAGEDGSPEDILDRTLEEVEYETWPPRSGGLQFF